MWRKHCADENISVGNPDSVFWIFVDCFIVLQCFQFSYLTCHGSTGYSIMRGVLPMIGKVMQQFVVFVKFCMQIEQFNTIITYLQTEKYFVYVFRDDKLFP